MNIFEAILLGAVEGLTEFLPISSTGHLTILEKLLGYSIDDPDITAFTAIIQARRASCVAKGRRDRRPETNATVSRAMSWRT